MNLRGNDMIGGFVSEFDRVFGLDELG